MNKALAEGLRTLARCLEQEEEARPQTPVILPAEDYDHLNYENLEAAAEALGFSMTLMRQIVHREDFPGYKLGTRWVVPKKALAEWNERQAREKVEL